MTPSNPTPVDDDLTDFERRTLENGWIERDFTGIRLAVAQIVAARVAAARADEREQIARVEAVAAGWEETGSLLATDGSRAVALRSALEAR